MNPATRTHRDAALVVCAIIGGVAWLALPIVLAMNQSRDSVLVAIMAGTALGAAAAITVVPRLSPLTAAVGGAIAALLVRGMLASWEFVPAGVDAIALETAGLAAAAAAASAWVMGRWTWQPRPITVTALVSLGMSAAVWVLGMTALLYLEGGVFEVLAVLLVAPVIGGAAVGLLVRDGNGVHVVLGWPALLGSLAIGAAIADGTPLALGPGLLSVLILGPLLSGLGAFGLYLARTWLPQAPEDLPAARLVP